MKKFILYSSSLILLMTTIYLVRRSMTKPLVQHESRHLKESVSLPLNKSGKNDNSEILTAPMREVEVSQDVTKLRDEFKNKLSVLKQATKTYNRLALNGPVTKEDEETYQLAVTASLVAQEQYKNAMVYELKKTKEF